MLTRAESHIAPGFGSSNSPFALYSAAKHSYTLLPPIQETKSPDAVLVPTPLAKKQKFDESVKEQPAAAPPGEPEVEKVHTSLTRDALEASVKKLEEELAQKRATKIKKLSTGLKLV